MSTRMKFFLGCVGIAAFLLYSLWFGWPGFESSWGWAEQGAGRPRWFPSAMGGAFAVGGSLIAFYLMEKWKTPRSKS
jgi:TRAP-type C4-dicarboxylate transport system permease small subunit